MTRREQPQATTEGTESARPEKVEARSSLIGPAKDSSRLSPQHSNGLGHSVELHIEELVLHGFNPANRYRIGEAVERELTRLITERGSDYAISKSRDIGHLDGGVFQVRPGSNSAVIGTHLARAIYGGLSR